MDWIAAVVRVRRSLNAWRVASLGSCSARYPNQNWSAVSLPEMGIHSACRADNAARPRDSRATSARRLTASGSFPSASGEASQPRAARRRRSTSVRRSRSGAERV